MMLGSFVIVIEFKPNGVVKTNKSKTFVDTLMDKLMKETMSTVQ
jgi:hypothetical protein